ncbi:MAG TPA: hypothetical protein ENN69_05540 [Spirochaetia bacterium]|nr:hypothetical protein [Spirochaetia bacterium]
MKTILVTDTQTPLGMSLLLGLMEAGFNVIAAPTARQEKKAYDRFKKKPLAVVPWNRGSSISAKNVVLACGTHFGGPDAALILSTPEESAVPFRTMKFALIEQIFDTHLKGSLFLLKGLADYMIGRPESSLTLAALSRPKNESPLLDELCRESLVHTVLGLQQLHKASQLHINAVLSRSADPAGVAAFIVKTLSEKCYKSRGRLFYYQWR